MAANNQSMKSRQRSLADKDSGYDSVTSSTTLSASMTTSSTEPVQPSFTLETRVDPRQLDEFDFSDVETTQKRKGLLKVNIPNFKTINSVNKECANFYLTLLIYTARTSTREPPDITSMEIAMSGFIISNGSDNLFCPYCKIEIEFPSSHTNLLAVHLAYNMDCEMAKALQLIRKHSLDIEAISKDRSSKVSHSSSDIQSEHLNLDGEGEHPSLVITRADAADNGAEGTERSGSSNAEDLTMFQYKIIASKLEHYRHEEVRLCSKADPSSHNPKHEVYRMASFTKQNLPDNTRVRLMVWRGLYLYGGRNSKEIKCAFCTFKQKFREEIITHSETATTLHKDHWKNNCGFSQGWNTLFNKPDIWNMIGYEYGRVVDASEQLSDESLTGVNRHADLGINLQLAKHTEMAVADRRMASFLTYPWGGKHPDVLYEAGYFYQGYGDSVTCFSCGIQSADWTTSSDVWVVHARSSRRCLFVILQKGQEFIDSVIAEYGVYLPKRIEDKITNVTTRMLRPRMDSLPVQKALEMGLNREAVRTVVGNRIKRGEPDFRCVADIVKAVNDLAIPESEVPGGDRVSSTLPRIVKPAEESTAIIEDSSSPSDTAFDEVETNPEPDPMEQNDDVTLTQQQTQGDTPAAIDIHALSNQIKSQLICKICMTEVVNIIYLPCAHLTCCSTCSAAMATCPLCRKEVIGTIKVNF